MSVALFHSVSKVNLFQNDGQQGRQASDGKQKREWTAGARIGARAPCAVMVTLRWDISGLQLSIKEAK